jgi:hypothetical protein
MVRAVEKVRERLLRTSAALEAGGVPYAIVGGNAVAAWVARVDAAAVRNTADVDVLLRRSDLEAAKAAMASAGFYHQEVSGVDMFIDGPQGGPREAVRVVFAAEKVRPADVAPNPEVTESEAGKDYRLISLEALVRMKLTAFRDKDRTHLRDLLDVGLVDPTWVGRFPAELGARLQQLIDTPGG